MKVEGDCCGDLSGIGFQSSLPVIVINTWGNSIPDEPKISGSMCTCAPSGEKLESSRLFQSGTIMKRIMRMVLVYDKR